MKINKYIILVTFVGMAFIVSSCLEGDEMNTPPGAVKPFIMMTNNPNGGTLVNSGVRYFGAQALLLDPTADNDTLTFAVALQGTLGFKKDINVTLTTPTEALDDVNDGIHYAMMPSTAFDLLSTSGTIAKGDTYAEFKVVFHPSKIDMSKDYMLPITATNDAGLVVSSNYGFIYYHIIGNPLAGQYRHYYRRYNNADTVGSTSGTLTENALFAPKDGTTVETSGGYASTVGLNAPYVIKFTNTGGVLSNMTVTIDAALAGGLTENGITITKAPIFVTNRITSTGKYFKIMYQVHNGTAYRTLIDEYWFP